MDRQNIMEICCFRYGRKSKRQFFVVRFMVGKKLNFREIHHYIKIGQVIEKIQWVASKGFLVYFEQRFD